MITPISRKAKRLLSKLRNFAAIAILDERCEAMNRVRDVWATNLEQEMATLRETVEHYPYIAVVRPRLFRPVSARLRPIPRGKEGYRIPWDCRPSDRRVQKP